MEALDASDGRVGAGQQARRTGGQNSCCVADADVRWRYEAQPAWSPDLYFGNNISSYVAMWWTGRDFVHR